jgi:hypothetical protein
MVCSSVAFSIPLSICSVLSLMSTRPSINGWKSMSWDGRSRLRDGYGPAVVQVRRHAAARLMNRNHAAVVVHIGIPAREISSAIHSATQAVDAGVVIFAAAAIMIIRRRRVWGCGTGCLAHTPASQNSYSKEWFSCMITITCLALPFGVSITTCTFFSLSKEGSRVGFTIPCFFFLAKSSSNPVHSSSDVNHRC